MPIQLWPKDYERKGHITKAEKMILRNAARNFSEGHIVVGIDPLGMSSDAVRMGMYISPHEGLITFSLYQGAIDPSNIDIYLMYVNMIEKKIYERLLDSKVLINRKGEYKTLKFQYKHILIFPDEKIKALTLTDEQKKQLDSFVAFDFFKPATSNGTEKMVSQLRIFDGVRMPCDTSTEALSVLECKAIFERLAPEYTIVIHETENIKLHDSKETHTEGELKISGKEKEFRTFFLDEYQVAQVNDIGKGHRVILANPGAGKSVILLSKAFKYASLYKGSNVLLTCFNSNLADAYRFKYACADFGGNNNLYIMTFHKLVKKLYEECLKSKCASNIATDEEIQKCIEMVKAGTIKLRFKAIFIDEVQIFNPLYLELCYHLLIPDEDRVFLMAGDLNQTVRADSKKGDVPWKKINGVKLDFTGRVKYIEKNYRNSREIAEYIYRMLKLMNTRFTMLNMINSLEYEYNSFQIGTAPTTALKVQLGIKRMQIQNAVISAIKEIVRLYKISYSDIAILFPYRQQKFLKYYFYYWITTALDKEGIPYSSIITSEDNPYQKKKYSETTGIVLSTIESSLGLDFKAVILAGLYPYNYVFSDNYSSSEIKSWQTIMNMSEKKKDLVQAQMRAIYTACSRARDVLYVLSDLKPGSPMEKILDV